MSRPDTPPDFGRYADVLGRITDFRPAGKSVQFRCLFPDRHKHGDRNWSGLAWIGETTGNLLARCLGCGAGWAEFVEAVGLPTAAWFPDKGRTYPAAPRPIWNPLMDTPTAVYSYRDDHGTLLHQKLRYEPKRFAQRRPLNPRHFSQLGIPPGSEAWVWGLGEGEYGRRQAAGRHDLTAFDAAIHQVAVQLPATPHVLYRLPELLAANPEHPVFLVEGEKDVETIRRLGFAATCTPSGGSALAWGTLGPLAGRRVVVVADNDTHGRCHAVNCAGILLSGGVRSVRVLWPGEAGFDVAAGGDITDWLAALGPDQDRRAAVVDLCKRFPEYKAW